MRRTVVGNVNVPDVDYSSFVCNCDLEEMGAQVANWITTQYHMVSETLPVGTVVTLYFKDGSTAQFQKSSATGTYRWGWNGKAKNSQNQPLKDQYGNLLNPKNPTAGGSGNNALCVSLSRWRSLDLGDFSGSSMLLQILYDD